MSKELKRHSVRGVKYNGEEICGGFAYYDADEVDALLAEKDKEIARLEAMRKVHVEAIASMEDRLHQDEKKIRRLCRALWLAREWRAWCEGMFWFVLESDKPRDVYHLIVTKHIHRTPTEWIAYWQKVEQKCKAKAEKYK